ncbi:hypothetical protein P3X46_018482, partial [Hevea brasiliensis]
MRDEVSNIIGVLLPFDHGWYLGLPSLFGKNKTQVFSYLRERLWKRISSWKGKFLLRVGKEILLNVFAIPISLWEELQKMINSFWWGSNWSGHRRIHWLSWDGMCLKKDFGGLGFCNLHCFNLAMLGWQCWRIISNPCTFLSRILKDKYFSQADFLDAQEGFNPSFLLLPIDVEAISNIPLSNSWKEDVRIWHYTKSSKLSVKLGYHLLATSSDWLTLLFQVIQGNYESFIFPQKLQGKETLHFNFNSPSSPLLHVRLLHVIALHLQPNSPISFPCSDTKLLCTAEKFSLPEECTRLEGPASPRTGTEALGGSGCA